MLAVLRGGRLTSPVTIKALPQPGFCVSMEKHESTTNCHLLMTFVRVV